MEKIKIKDMPKLESPFVRKMVDGNYIVTDEITEGYEWVFEDDTVMAIEKLHGTCVSIVIQEGTVIAIYNRTERIPFINKGKKWLVEALLEAKERGYIDKLGDGQWFGEVIGEKVNGNPYKIKGHLWIPFETYAQEHLRYKAWGKYPKDFKTISTWFKEDLLPLFMLKRGSKKEDADAFVEGIVFTSKDGKMAKLRRNMYSWFNEVEVNKGEKNAKKRI